jgi:hypothetical protein
LLLLLLLLVVVVVVMCWMLAAAMGCSRDGYKPAASTACGGVGSEGASSLLACISE